MSSESLVRPDGTYACVPLAKDEISLCVVQSRVRAVDVSNRDASLKANLDHMLGLIDAANGWLGPKDIVFFHEFPLTGFNASWKRTELLQAAIERARAAGCGLVQLTSDKARNDALRFYAELGFVASHEGLKLGL